MNVYQTIGGWTAELDVSGVTYVSSATQRCDAVWYLKLMVNEDHVTHHIAYPRVQL